MLFHLICGGILPAVALNFTWVTDDGGSASKRGAGLVIFGMLGQTGSIVGSRFFPKEGSPCYIKGMGISAGLLFFAAILAQFLGSLMRWESHSRNAIHSPMDKDKNSEAMINSGDDHPNFRFIF
jgi:hypothetical protein